MAALHTRACGADVALHPRREFPLGHYLTRIALFVIVLVSTASAAKEVSAACTYSSLDNRLPLKTSDTIPMTVAFGPSDVSDTGDPTLRFEKSIKSTKSRILAAPGEIKILTFDEQTEVEQIYRQGTGLLAVIDPQFMKEGKPKYNSLLLSFKDTTIAADQILILDPWPIGENLSATKPDRAFIQITSTITPEMLPYLLELAAWLWYDSSLFSTPEFAEYASLVTDEAADGGSLRPGTLEVREAVIVNCLEMGLQR